MIQSTPPHERLFSYAGARRIDEISQEYGLGEMQLMGQAALASLYRLRSSGRFTPGARERGGRLIVLAGTGNNGGDGYALLYHLLADSSNVADYARVFRTGEPRGDAARFYATAVERSGIPIEAAEAFADFETRPDDLIIEALLGTGQDAAPRGAAGEMLIRLRRLRASRNAPGMIALDVPAGLRENEMVRFAPPGPAARTPMGLPEDAPPAPDEIHCYGVGRIALRLNADLAAFSQTVVLPMGFHPEAIRTSAESESPVREIPLQCDPGDFRKSPVDHKYTSGHGVLIAGSPGFEGAALLAGQAFFAGGGGILHLGTTREDSRQLITAAVPTIMTRLVGPELFKLRPPAILIGPGLAAPDLERLRPDLVQWLSDIAAQNRDESQRPILILDAGALELIRDRDFPERLRERTILTPHSGEWERLGGPSIQGRLNGLNAAAAWAREELGCFVLVKDAVSCLFEPGNGGTALFAEPQPELSVAGSGDVLAGLLLARLARKDPADRAPGRKIESVITLHSIAAGTRLHPTSQQLIEAIRETLKGDAPEPANE